MKFGHYHISFSYYESLLSVQEVVPFYEVSHYIGHIMLKQDISRSIEKRLTDCLILTYSMSRK